MGLNFEHTKFPVVTSILETFPNSLGFVFPDSFVVVAIFPVQ